MPRPAAEKARAMTDTPHPAADRAEALLGMIERVTFHNPESGFAVLRVKARGHRDLISLVGIVPDVNPGEWVEARGHWEIDRQHGRQFRAGDVRVAEPDTLEGIEKYLGSGLIRGIGPHFARKLVEKFGRDVFDVIDRRSALLLTVDGIGATRREAIRAAWAEQKTVREIMSFLMSCGVSTARAHRIYREYGEKAIEKVRLDPYCLARDIHGIGFKSADAIGEQMGIARDSDLRARAGVEHVLQELTDEGHCAYPRGDLGTAAEEMLSIGREIVERAIDHGVGEKRLVLVPGPDGAPLVYLAPLEFAERELARALARLASGPPPLAGIDVERAMGWVEDRIRLQLDGGQREALREALTRKVLVLTGGPGVGKTTLVNAIVRVYRAKRLRVSLCAPTGRAAKRLSESAGLPAKTIHRLLIFDPATRGFRHDAANRLDTDLLVVDETSMLDVMLAWQLVRAIPAHAAVVFVGDADQLPPVGPGHVLRDLIESDVLPVCRLKHIFRQAAQSRIVVNAHRINEGGMPECAETAEGAPPPPSDFYFVNGDDPSRAVQQILRLVREAVPRRFRLDPFEDIQVLSPMQRGELGARNLNQVLQAALNPAGASVEKYGTVFRIGDKVMQIENDYGKDVFNGDIGRIAGVDDASRVVHVRFDDRLIPYSYPELDELAPAYAITIHKSQGSEYPCVIVPVHTQHYVMLQRNLLYTAVTRGRRLVVLVGSKKAVAMAVHRAESARRVTLLRERLRAAGGGRAPAS